MNISDINILFILITVKQTSELINLLTGKWPVLIISSAVVIFFSFSGSLKKQYTQTDLKQKKKSVQQSYGFQLPDINSLFPADIFSIIATTITEEDVTNKYIITGICYMQKIQY